MKVTVKYADALEALEKNLHDHVRELSDAMEVWTSDVTIELNALRAAMTKDALTASNQNLMALFYKKPVDNRVQYSKYIGLLKRAIATMDTLEIDEDEYDRIFNDNWEWRAQSKTLNAAYSTRKA